MRKMCVAILCLMRLFASAQFPTTPPVQCSMESNNGALVLYADNKTFATYTLKFNFSDLAGYNGNISNDAVINVEPGRHMIAKFTRSSGGFSTTGIRYSYASYRGTAFRKAPDSNFVYLLPARESVELMASKTNLVGTKFRIDSYGKVLPDVSDEKEKERQQNYYGIGFKYHKGDTICAARAGTVVEVVSENDGDSKNQIFNAKRNNIVIEQKDGTIMNYNITSAINPLIEVGNRVIPGEPLAIFTSEDDKYSVLISVSYLDEKKLNAATRENPTSPNVTVPLLFFTGEKAERITGGKYKCVYAKEIILQELDKRQKKKLNF